MRIDTRMRRYGISETMFDVKLAIYDMASETHRASNHPSVQQLANLQGKQEQRP